MKDNADYSEELDIAKSVAIEIGKVQLEKFRKNLKVIRKDVKEFVSDVDIHCQKLASKLLSQKFDYPLLSEENRGFDIEPSDTYWVIDPVDGTHNFIAGVPNFGVSIGLVSKNDFVMGVVFLPFFDELFYAVKGQGAFLNGEKIEVSKNDDLEKSMVTYDNQFYLNKDAFSRYRKLIDQCFTTRIFGSAIYDFGLITSGRIDARIWNNTKIFDFAAGTVIVEEAGGKVTDFEGNRITPKSKQIIASNGHIHDSLIKIFKNNKAEVDKI